MYYSLVVPTFQDIVYIKFHALNYIKSKGSVKEPSLPQPGTIKAAYPHLAQALRSPHHAGGPHGLVRRDEQEALHIVGRGGLRQDIGAVLHKRHVLMRGRVQHPGRLMRFKKILQQAFVPHIPRHGNNMPGKALLAQFLVYIEQRGIVAFKQPVRLLKTATRAVFPLCRRRALLRHLRSA